MLIGAGILIFVPVFVSRDFEVGSKYRSRPPVPHRANFFIHIFAKMAIKRLQSGRKVDMFLSQKCASSASPLSVDTPVWIVGLLYE